MPSVLESILAVLAQGGSGYFQGKIRKREREREKDEKEEDEEQNFLRQLQVLASQNQVSPEVPTGKPPPVAPMALNMTMQGNTPIPGAPRATPPGGYVQGSQGTEQSPLQRIIGTMQGVQETRPANALELLTGVAQKRREQQETENIMSMEELRQKDPMLQLQAKSAAEALKLGRHIARIDPETGEYRFLNVNELADEIASGETIKRKSESDRELAKIVAQHTNRMIEMVKSAEMAYGNAEALEKLKQEHRKEFEKIKGEMNKPEHQYKYGNLDRLSVDKMSEIGNVKQTLTLVENQIDQIEKAFGLGSRTTDTIVRYMGGAGAAKADALISQLKTSIYGVAGKAWTGPELKELRNLVPQRGEWWFGDSDAEMRAKLEAIAEKLDIAMRNLLTIELSQGKRFDVDAVLSSHGFSNETLGLPKITILPPEQTTIEQDQSGFSVEEIEAIRRSMGGANGEP